MADILFGGLHFDRKRFKRDIDLFKPRKADADTASPLWDWGATVHAAAPSSRAGNDGSNDEAEKVNAGKKRGKATAAESSEEEVEADDTIKGGADAKGGRKEPKTKADRWVKEQEVEDREVDEEDGVALFKGSAADRRLTDGSTGVGKKKASKAAREQEEAAILRKRLRIHVKGTLVPLPLQHLSELADRSSSRQIRHVIEGLAARGIVEPSPIQRQAIPVLLQGRELFACSATGSGKTLAFLLPLLLRLVDRPNEEQPAPQASAHPEPAGAPEAKPPKKQNGKAIPSSNKGSKATPSKHCWGDANGTAATPSSKARGGDPMAVMDASVPVPADGSEGDGSGGKGGVRAVVLCPTKELAQQTMREWQKLFHHTAGSSAKAVGLRALLLTKATAAGVDLSASAPSPVDIVFATPLLLGHLLEAGKVNLQRAEFLVLDEADKLFEMGFVEQIDAILAACDASRVRKALFSATLPDTVEELARTVMHDPVRVTIGERNAAASTVSQKLLFVGREEGKLLAIRQMVKEGLNPPMLIFVHSKERANDLFKELAYDGLKVDVIHADRTPAQRAAVVDNFRAGKIWVLITTDVMARGMDFKGVNCVMNFDFPESATSYVHRIGRCGRAGRPGTAVTLFTESDAPCLRSIANVMVASGCEVPKWMLSLGLQSKKRKKTHLPRHPISTMAKFDRIKQKNRRDAISSSKKRKMQSEKAATKDLP